MDQIQGAFNVKRLFDLVVATAILFTLAPIVALVALIIGYKLGWPVLFTQTRPGHNGRLFNMVKFRSMSNERDAAGTLLPDQQRLGKFGRFLRSTSLDELPELLNVIKGDMSLVGPRPLFAHYLPLYSQEQARRHEVRPGITGWAQVNGRNDVDWPARFALDVWYVENHTLWLDLKILAMTLLRVVQRDGINPQGKVEMEWFTGETK